MQKLLASVVLASVLGVTPARADFVLSGPSLPEPADVTTPSVHPNRGPVRTRSPTIVEGFGRQVPLSFAVRQIVPPSVHVTYGPNVDTNALVDWSGGAPWDQVLRSAAKPLGLRLAMGRGSVELRQ